MHTLGGHGEGDGRGSAENPPSVGPFHLGRACKARPGVPCPACPVHAGRDPVAKHPMHRPASGHCLPECIPIPRTSWGSGQPGARQSHLGRCSPGGTRRHRSARMHTGMRVLQRQGGDRVGPGQPPLRHTRAAGARRQPHLDSQALDVQRLKGLVGNEFHGDGAALVVAMQCQGGKDAVMAGVVIQAQDSGGREIPGCHARKECAVACVCRHWPDSAPNAARQHAREQGVVGWGPGFRAGPQIAGITANSSHACRYPVRIRVRTPRYDSAQCRVATPVRDARCNCIPCMSWALPRTSPRLLLRRGLASLPRPAAPAVTASACPPGPPQRKLPREMAPCI